MYTGIFYDSSVSITIKSCFLIIGILILHLGYSVYKTYYDYFPLLPESYETLSNIYIWIGVITIFLAMVVFVAPLRCKYALKIMYFALMVIIFVVLVLACIAGVMLMDETMSFVLGSSRESLYVYGENFEVTKLWDHIQQEYSCCGILSADDWLKPLATEETKELPISCCWFPQDTVVSIIQCNIDARVHVKGCLGEIESLFHMKLVLITVSGATITLLQGLLLVGSISKYYFNNATQFESKQIVI